MHERPYNSISDAIGNTPLVRLNRTVNNINAFVFAKCEFMNPGGSIKDRVALHIINEAERKGLLKPGGTIVEATSGNTGLGLAMIAANRGYKCIFVMADKQSEEKRTLLKSVGATVVICPTDVPADDERSYYKVAAKIVRETPGAFYADQYRNPNNPNAHYFSTGKEIYDQCSGQVDILATTLGTGGTVSGIARYLKERIPNLFVLGIDPVGSIYYELFYKKIMPVPHTYLVEGIGEDFLPDTIDLNFVSEIVQVTDAESFHMARRIISEEGLFVGGSSGSTIAGLNKYAKARPELFAGKRVVTIMPDSFTRYVSKFLSDKWLQENL